MEFKGKAQARKDTGLSYLGSVNMTTKHKKGFTYNELNYSLYLSPANVSGYEVCPGRTAECTRLCLNESGMNTMVQKVKGDVINSCRIKKTRLFFEHREYFVRWMIAEIETVKKKAERLGYGFNVRINNTSDIDPREMSINLAGRSVNILEYFPDVQFYDYTKVPTRIEIAQQYPNYDLTFSYTGYNWLMCKVMLNEGIRVAVIFKKVLPETYEGYPVIDGDLYDNRTKDAGVIIGLKFKKVRAKLLPTDKFVIQ
jgi:hypothetical protein